MVGWWSVGYRGPAGTAPVCRTVPTVPWSAGPGRARSAGHPKRHNGNGWASTPVPVSRPDRIRQNSIASNSYSAAPLPCL